MSQPADGFFFDLPDPFPGKIKFLSDFFQCHFLNTDTKEEFDDVSFSFSKGGMPGQFPSSGFTDQLFIRLG